MGEVVYGPSHARSVLGILKLIEIVVCLIAVILIASRGWTNALINAFYVGTIIGIIISLIIFILCLTEAGHSLNGVLKFQFFSHLTLFIYLVIVSSIMVARYSSYYKAGGIFGLIAAVVYLIDAFISYRSYDFRF